ISIHSCSPDFYKKIEQREALVSAGAFWKNCIQQPCGLFLFSHDQIFSSFSVSLHDLIRLYPKYFAKLRELWSKYHHSCSRELHRSRCCHYASSADRAAKSW